MKVRELLDSARLALNDPRERRWADAELFRYYVMFILTARRIRPDLFLGKLTQDLSVEFEEGLPAIEVKQFHLPSEFAAKCHDFITARALMKDSEAASTAKAESYFRLAGT